MLRKFAARLLGFEREMEELKSEVRRLSWDESFGMLTREGIVREVSRSRQRLAVAFLDLDGIHRLNSAIGYEAVNERIRRVFETCRKSDLVKAGRYFSGDEVLVLAPEKDALKAALSRLTRNAEKEGLSFTCAIGSWEPGKEELGKAIEGLSKRVLEMKQMAKARLREAVVMA